MTTLLPLLTSNNHCSIKLLQYPICLVHATGAANTAHNKCCAVQ